MMALFVIILVSLVANIHSKVSLIIDTDIGSDFDDSVAVAYAVSRQDIFDIRLVLTATKNTTQRALLTAKYLQYMNASHIDIGIGIQVNNSHGCTQCSWADGYSFNDYYPGKIYYNGIKQAEQIISSATPNEPVYIVGIAPLTNLGQIFLNNPNYKQNVRFITMGGAINPSGAEYNIVFNISASEIVYNYTNVVPYSINICGAPLDSTLYYQIYGSNYQRFYDAQSWNLISSTVIQNYQVWYDNGGDQHTAYRPFNVSTATSTMFDPVAMFIASIMAEYAMNDNRANLICTNGTVPFLEMKPYPIVVNDSGYTISYQNHNVPNVYEAISWLPDMNNGTWNLGTYQVNWMLQYNATFSH